VTGIPLCRASQILPFSSWLDDAGVSSAPLLRRVGLPLEPADDPDRWIAEIPIWRFCEEVTRSQGLEDFGLRVGIGSDVTEIGAFGRSLSGSATLGAALAFFLSDVNRHSTCAAFGLHREGEFVWFSRSGVRGYESAPIEQYVVGLMVRIVRLAAGSLWSPDRIRLQGTALPGQLSAEMFSDTRFQRRAEVTAIRFSAGLLSQSIRARPTAQSLAIESSLTNAPESDLAGSLRIAIEHVMRDGAPNLYWAADVSGMSTRTLRRRLVDLGLSWSSLVTQTRFDTALRLLSESELEIREIAREVGYSDPANFSRAFRRWTGDAPSRYRNGS
jgi:AraC-like DNA-binding protein